MPRSASRQLPTPHSHEQLLAILLQAQRLRSTVFHTERFGEAAWGILLDLYRAHLLQRRVSERSACISSGVSMSAALRWLSALEERGLIVWREDPAEDVVGITRKERRE